MMFELEDMVSIVRIGISLSYCAMSASSVPKVSRYPRSCMLDTRREMIGIFPVRSSR
jgi:hypothetical protein